LRKNKGRFGTIVAGVDKGRGVYLQDLGGKHPSSSHRDKRRRKNPIAGPKIKFFTVNGFDFRGEKRSSAIYG